MSEEGSYNQFDVDEFVNQWEGLSPGHQEDQSHLARGFGKNREPVASKLTI